MATPAQPKARGNNPPYISFRTLTGFLQKLKETAVPGRVDSSVLRSFSGSVARQLVLALKYLQLLDSESNTTERLKKLVAAHGTPNWKEELGSLAMEVYQPVIGKLDLESGTHGQLVEAFRNTGADGFVLERAISFFLAAVKEAGITVSPHFTDRQRRPRGSSPRKAAKKKAAVGEDDELDEDDEPEGDEADEGTASQPTKRAKFQLPVPGKRHATIWLPGDVSSEDWSMIDLMMKAYVARLEKGAKQA